MKEFETSIIIICDLVCIDLLVVPIIAMPLVITENTNQYVYLLLKMLKIAEIKQQFS